MFIWQFFFYDTGPPFDDFIYWMILFWLNLSYLIHSLQRLFTYNLEIFLLYCRIIAALMGMYEA